MKTCKISIKRNFLGLGRINKVTAKDCDYKQIESALKKRNINLGEINLIKTN